MLPQLQQPDSFATPAKLPKICQSDPAPWFKHMEVLFHLRGISAKNFKYYLMAAALDQQPTGRTMHLLWAPPQTRKYTALKQLLLRRYSPSAEENADKLLFLPGLGSAVDLMDDLLSLLGLNEGSFLFPYFPAPTPTSVSRSPSKISMFVC